MLHKRESKPDAGTKAEGKRHQMPQPLRHLWYIQHSPIYTIVSITLSKDPRGRQDSFELDLRRGPHLCPGVLVVERSVEGMLFLFDGHGEPLL